MSKARDIADSTTTLDVDGGTIKLDGNYPVGTYNVALGDAAGAAITSGGRNTLIGGNAGDALTSGQRNVAIGTDALSADTQGSRSVAIGQAALTNQNFTSATDNYNVAVGFQAGVNVSTGITNTMIGGFALTSNSTASENTALGYQAGYSTSTGGANTAVGVKALYLNTTAVANTALGWNAAYSNTTGASNVAIGYQSLASNTTASYNTSVGYQAGYTNQTGILSTFVGYSSGLAATGDRVTAIGSNALQALTSGTHNTAIGQGSGNSITTGSKNSILGMYNGNQGGLDIRTSSNNIVLSDGDGNPRWQFDGTTWYAFTFASGAGTNAVKFNTTTGAFTYDTSSLRYKDNIRDSAYGLSHVMQMRSAQFEYKDTGRSDVGLIAEELDLIIPELVGKNKDNEPDSVSYDRLVSVLVRAIQEQQATITALTDRITALEGA